MKRERGRKFQADKEVGHGDKNRQKNYLFRKLLYPVTLPVREMDTSPSRDLLLIFSAQRGGEGKTEQVCFDGNHLFWTPSSFIYRTRPAWSIIPGRADQTQVNQTDPVPPPSAAAFMREDARQRRRWRKPCEAAAGPVKTSAGVNSQSSPAPSPSRPVEPLS